MTEQAEKFGAKRVSDMIKEVELEGEVKVLKSEKNEYRGKNVIMQRAHMQDRSDAKEKDSSGEKVFLIVQHVMRTFLKILKYM